MKKFLLKIFKAIVIIASASILLFVLEAFFPPARKVIGPLIFGEVYHHAGEAAITVSGRPETLAVYKKENKPFVLIHFRYHRDWKVEEDFFFVNPKQVIGTAMQDGIEEWFCVGPLLWVLDDMSSALWRVRMPYWDHLDQKGASVEYDAAKDEYVYRFLVNSPREPAVLRCPAKFFTPDLLAAPNDTIHE